MIGIHKPTQGTWVRRFSAVGAGLLGLAAAAWVWSQLSAVDLPIGAYDYTVSTADPGLEVGQPVTLTEPPLEAGEDEAEVGSGVVAEILPRTANTATVRVAELTGREREVRIDETTTVLQRVGPEFATTIRAGDTRLRVAASRAVEAVSRTYVQAAGAGAVILLSAVLIYWLIGVNRKASEFLIATDGEMKKVHWSSRREVIGSTQVVIVAAVLIAALLFTIDLGFAWFFRNVGVLEGS